MDSGAVNQWFRVFTTLQINEWMNEWMDDTSGLHGLHIQSMDCMGRLCIIQSYCRNDDIDAWIMPAIKPCLSSGIIILAGGSSVPLISARKGTNPPLEARAFHTLRLIARQPPTSVTSLCSDHWLAGDFHSWFNSWIDCQTNVYTIWLSMQQFNQLSNQQLDRLFVQLSDPYSNRVNALLR